MTTGRSIKGIVKISLAMDSNRARLVNSNFPYNLLQFGGDIIKRTLSLRDRAKNGGRGIRTPDLLLPKQPR